MKISGKMPAKILLAIIIIFLLLMGTQCARQHIKKQRYENQLKLQKEKPISTTNKIAVKYY